MMDKQDEDSTNSQYGKREEDRDEDVHSVPNNEQNVSSSALILTDEKDVDCSICHDAEPFADRHALPCGHKFHKICIDEWLKRKPTCPLCRWSNHNTSSEAFGEEVNDEPSTEMETPASDEGENDESDEGEYRIREGRYMNLLDTDSDESSSLFGEVDPYYELDNNDFEEEPETWEPAGINELADPYSSFSDKDEEPEIRDSSTGESDGALKTSESHAEPFTRKSNDKPHIMQSNYELETDKSGSESCDE